MTLSRRNLLLQSTAFALAASIRQKASALPLPSRSIKKGLAGVAPGNSGLTTNWYYDWKLHPATTGLPAADPAIHFHPMCWSWKPAKPTVPGSNQKPAEDADGSTPEGVNSLRSHHPALLFGFNEPDKTEQANLTVEAAVEAWPALQGIARELVSPSCAKPQGDWMAKFVPEIERRKLQLNSLGYHTYPSDSVDSFIEHLESFHTLYQRPIWVTEFAVADWAAKDGKTVNRFSVERVADFMKGACAYMDRTPWIRGYAWFPRGGKFATAEMKGPLASSVLLNADGTLNDLGKLYGSL